MNSKSPQTDETYEEQVFAKISQMLEEKMGLKTFEPKRSKCEFGNVLFVQDINTNLKYVVQAQSIIDENKGGIDDNRLEMCKAESEILKSINHKNILEYHSDYTIGFYHFIQMNLYECSLDDWIQKRGKTPISTSLFLHFLNQILDGIEHLHSLNYVLRDLSTRNILISTDGTVKLCDFGLTKKIQSQEISKIESNNEKGSFAYYPPELVKELQNNSNAFTQSKSGDIWALGICLSLLGGLTILDVAYFNQPEAKIQQAPLLNKDCNQIIQFILNKNSKERPLVTSIRKLIFDQLNSNNEELQINQSNKQFKTQEEIDNFYNERELDIDITKYIETEKECLENLNKIESLIKLGYINLFYHYDFDKTYQYFINALQLNQNDPDIYLGLSQMLLERQSLDEKEYDMIEQYIDKAHQISPNYWRVYFIKALQQHMKSQNNDTLISFKKSIEIKKNHSLLICFKYEIESLLSEEKFQKQQIFNKIIDENFSIKYRLYYIHLAQIACQQEEYEKSNELYFEELKYFPKCIIILCNIANNYSQMQQYENAVKYLEKALEINPFVVFAQKYLAYIRNVLIEEKEQSEDQ